MNEQTLTGQKFTPAEAAPGGRRHHAAGKTFEVAEECQFDFSGKGAPEAAVRVRRLPSGQMSTMRKADFLRDFKALTAA